MKAARIFPSPTGGRLRVTDILEPSPAAGQVLVRVMASALNRGELIAAANAKSGDPLPAGIECAGVIQAVGPGVTAWRAGDAVMGHGRGTHQELAVLAADALFARPAAGGWAEAAAFPNTFITVHDALVTHGRMQRGAAVLVNAASSGIGIAAMQLARALGAAAVIGVSRSAEKLPRLLQWGATHVVDASGETVGAAVSRITGGQGVDIIIDSVGGSALADNLAAAALEGRIVQVGRLGGTKAEIDLDRLAYKRVELIGVTFRTRTEAERLGCIARCRQDVMPLLESGQIRPVVAERFALDDIERACDVMLADRHVGKIVIDIAGTD